ncbi:MULTISPECIES: ParA family protein [Peptoniphilus]|jgi:sporulation initiation inhibitor protein Soj|uniref:ParA family protein n=1 Tax=Peptoniphilus TaxID=162289 RepID=UPI000287F9AC|nr:MULTISPECIES: ParA family protein [Peptoniphilus]MDU1043143.1 ParA family protein [Peptoniphilus rhinitidis]MDU1954961.1 ParA family protein [Peptoniphilus lacydonensis]MDU2109417.1 ParA family protein [Peptoniphilus lacydonensis]MDU2114876.1 ParA family protein [Peptoniphilus lacydonensis]MDU3750726.1 ParA family protein [Peptoniphilus rhinitidis]
MSVVITVFNQKGGVGKSTTVINLSSALALRGKRTLIIDMDPQGNSTSGLGVYEFKNMIYDFLIDEKVDSIYKTGFSKLDIIPSNGEFAGVEIELARCEDWQFKLKKMLDKVKDNYDYVIIDSPPSLGILSMMSLVASDKILIPVQCEYYALEGVSQLMDTITLVKDNFNPNLNILGIVMSMYDGRTNLSNQVVEEVEKFFKDKVFKTYIPRNVRLAEAPSFGMNIFDYDSKSKGAKAYIDLAKEVIGEVNGEEK